MNKSASAAWARASNCVGSSLENGLVKCLVWYDNGWGYAYRLLELARKMAGLIQAKEVAR